jgi:hypothetical protein
MDGTEVQQSQVEETVEQALVDRTLVVAEIRGHGANLT